MDGCVQVEGRVDGCMPGWSDAGVHPPVVMLQVPDTLGACTCSVAAGPKSASSRALAGSSCHTSATAGGARGGGGMRVESGMGGGRLKRAAGQLQAGGNAGAVQAGEQAGKCTCVLETCFSIQPPHPTRRPHPLHLLLSAPAYSSTWRSSLRRLNSCGSLSMRACMSFL